MVHSPQVHQGRGRATEATPQQVGGHARAMLFADLAAVDGATKPGRLDNRLPLRLFACARSPFGARAELDEFLLFVPIEAHLRASWWHLPQCLWRPVLALWCVYQSACKVASYLLGAIVSVLKGLGTRVGAHGARPGEGRGRAFYAKTACMYERGC